MYKRATIFLACPTDFQNPGPALDWLARISQKDEQGGPSLFLAVGTKFKTPSGIRTFNIETNYPAQLPQLATHAAWSSMDEPRHSQHRDTRAIFCLHQFSQAHPDAREIVLMLGDPGESGELIEDIRAQSSNAPLLCLEHHDQEQSSRSGPIVRFDRNRPDAEAALTLTLDIALTGAIYAIEAYSLATLLDQAVRAASMLSGFSTVKAD